MQLTATGVLHVYFVISVDVDSSLCRCMQSAGVDWPSKCFDVRVLYTFLSFNAFILYTGASLIEVRLLIGGVA